MADIAAQQSGFLTCVFDVDANGQWVFDSIAGMKLEDEAKYNFTEPVDVLAKTPTKSRRAVVSGLEAHSTVLE